MNHQWTETDTDRTVAYQWRCKGKWQRFSVRAEKEPADILLNSEVEFITEHYWGYARYSDLKTNEYEVKHPKWLHYPVKDYIIDVDFELTYGTAFKDLNNQKPVSVMLAEGSEISVEKKRTFRIKNIPQNR